MQYDVVNMSKHNYANILNYMIDSCCDKVCYAFSNGNKRIIVDAVELVYIMNGCSSIKSPYLLILPIFLPSFLMHG